MKRKTLIVLLVLLLVGILAFTVFACNNNKKPDNPGTDTPGGDGPGPDDDDPPEDETYAIVEALPELVTGLDKVAATVGAIDSGKAAYLGADIGLNFGVTAEGLDVAADLVLSLKVSVDEDTAANNWALIGLKSDNKDVAQLYIHAEAANKEVIYIKEAFTGSNNWKVLSVLDVSEKPDLEGLFTGSNYGLIGKLFSLVTGLTAEDSTFPIDFTAGLTAEDSTFPIDFTADSPIGGLEIMEGSSINQLLGTVKLLGKVVDGALHAEAFDNGNRYVATLNRAGIGDLIGGLTGTFDLGDLLTTLEKLNPVLRLVLGMEVKEGKFNVLKYDDPDDAPVLDIEFSVDPDTAALTDLSIDFANGDIEGMGITLGLALSNIVLSDESEAPTVDTANAEALGINLDLEARLPAWPKAATIAVSVDPDATIGWDKNGKIQIDLSNIKGYATFNGETIAEYKTHNNEKGFAINLAPVYAFIAPEGTGDQRANVYFINCDLDAIINLTKAQSANLSNAAFADETENETADGNQNKPGTLKTLIDAIKALSQPGADILGGIGNIIGPALTDSNSIVKLLLAEITKGDSITFDPELGEDITTSASVTVNASALVEFAMGENLLGGIESLINITLYDVAAAQEAIDPDLSNKEAEVNKKQPITLTQIFEDGDLIEVIIDLVYTAMYENYAKTNPDVTFAQYVQDGDIVYNRDAIAGIADHLGFDLSGGTDGKFDAADLGNIVATITYGDSLSAKLEVLGAYIQIGADLNAYKAPNASIDTTGVEKPMGSYTDQGKLVVAFNGSDLEKALLELAGYALSGQKDLFLQTSDGE